jgi:hypothetical protein
MAEFENAPHEGSTSERVSGGNGSDTSGVTVSSTGQDDLRTGAKAGDFAGFENGSNDAVTREASVAIPAAGVVEAPSFVARPALRSLFLARIIQALWFGSGVFVMFAALAVFRALAPDDAADAVGAMLTRWHYIALLAPAILTIIEWRRARSLMVTILFVAVLLAVLQGFSDLRIRRMRAQSPVAISALDRNDPVRRRFGLLHGLSSMLLIAQIAAAAGAIAAEPESDR